MLNLTAAMVNNLMSHSRVPLVDAPEHRIMPLGEDELSTRGVVRPLSSKSAGIVTILD